MKDIELNLLSRQHILVVGDLMVDRYLYGEVSRISPEAPVPVARIAHTELKVGGAGNVALNITALGSSVRVLSCIGRDRCGEILIANLLSQGVDTSYIVQQDDKKTSIKTRVVAQNQQLLRYDEEQITPIEEHFIQYVTNHIEPIFENVNAVILSDYGKGILQPKLIQLIIAQARERAIPVLVDPKGTDYSKYRGATVCTPNLKELKEASGYTNLQKEESILQAGLSISKACGIEYVLATRSEKGMSLICGSTKEKEDFPAVAQEISDVTGAGDTVISTFALGMASKLPLDICCQLANIAASIVVSKFGASTANIEEMLETIENQKQLAERKSVSCTQIAEITKRLHKKGKKIVFTNGCFDIVHAGHVSSFRQAHSYGDVLIVGVNSDESIRRLKGKTRPIVELKDRIALLEELESIDYIVAFEEDTPQKLIEAVRPDILVKGKDWEHKQVAGSEFIKSYGGKIVYAELEQGLSTSSIIEKILKANGVQA